MAKSAFRRAREDAIEHRHSGGANRGCEAWTSGKPTAACLGMEKQHYQLCQPFAEWVRGGLRTAPIRRAVKKKNNTSLLDKSPRRNASSCMHCGAPVRHSDLLLDSRGLRQ